MPLARETGVCRVAAVKGDAAPVHELPCRRRRDAQGVVVINHPRAALADAAGTGVEPHGDALVGDIAALNLERPKQRRPELHPLPGRALVGPSFGRVRRAQ